MVRLDPREVIIPYTSKVIPRLVVVGHVYGIVGNKGDVPLDVPFSAAEDAPVEQCS
jgi:hypothetical protein